MGTIVSVLFIFLVIVMVAGAVLKVGIEFVQELFSKDDEEDWFEEGRRRWEGRCRTYLGE